MQNDALLGLVMLGIFVVGGMLLARLLLRAIYPLRVELFEMGSDLANDPSARPLDRRMAEFYMDTATCFEAGWLVLHAVVETVVQKFRRSDGHPASDAVQGDARRINMGVRYMLSALVANPFALVLVTPVFVTLLLLDRCRPKIMLRDAGAHIRPPLHGMARV